MLRKYVKKKAKKIEDNDRVIINGIYVGYNYRTNKYIIQLVKPDFAKLPHETVVNDVRVEVPAKYVKRVPKRQVEEANLVPSLTDRVSITANSPSSPVASHHQKAETLQHVHSHHTNNSSDEVDEQHAMAITNRNIIEEWSSIIGDNDSSSMELDVAETCDAWTINDCDPCKRIVFCLSYYKLWINHKFEQKKNKEKAKEMDKHGVFKEYLCEFMQSLSQYSSQQMLNDFHHIKQFHINNNNNQHNHSIDGEDKQDVFEYFKREMGICNHMNCRSYSRNNRDRTECTESNAVRRGLYFIDESKITGKDDEISETNLQQLFDMIHCTLLHPQSATTGTNTTKFITEIDSKQPDKNNKRIKAVVEEEQKKHKAAEEKQCAAETEEEEEEAKKEQSPEEQVQTAVLSSYGFGAQFKYHDASKGHKLYIRKKYANLKQEVMSNSLYNIGEFDYDSIQVKAHNYLVSYRGRSMKASKQSNLNNLCKIKPNEPIKIEHIIALMLYTNMDDLQREFKKGCRYLASDGEMVERVKGRNREIANWCRLLWESITFYGESISAKQVFYHGLNCKLLFNSVVAAFNCPTSTTVNKSVAFNFSTENGIIVQLGKFGSLDSHYLDVSDLSDYPNEQERLFFQAQLGFEDIIYNNTSNKYYIKCLSLFQYITQGKYFTYNTRIFKKKHQKTLIKMMNCCIDKAEKEKSKIPQYMQQLFEHYCKSIQQFGNIMWLNKEEFSKLNENVRDYLSAPTDSIKTSNNINFFEWLQKEYKISIKYPKTISFVVKNDEEKGGDENKQYLDQFWDGKSVQLPSISYVVHDGMGKKDKVTLKFKLKKGATKTDGTALITVKLVMGAGANVESSTADVLAGDNDIKEKNNKKNEKKKKQVLPDYAQKLKCDIGVFCPQIQFSFTTAMNVSKKLGAIPLCPSSQLEGLDAFEWKVFVKERGRVDKKNLVHKL